jgi:hypothetical protein
MGCTTQDGLNVDVTMQDSCCINLAIKYELMIWEDKYE